MSADAGGLEGPSTVIAAFARSARTLSRIDEVVDAVVEAALTCLGADSIHLSRMEHSRGHITVLRNAGELAPWEHPRPDDESYPIAAFPFSVMIADQAAPWRATVDDPVLPEAERELMRSLGKRAALGVPIVTGDRVWGEIYACRTDDRPFDDVDLDRAEILAELTGAAIVRIDSLQPLERLANTDPLTGLANRRAIDLQLAEWAADPNLSGSIAVVLCDVDDLKVVNDQHGHGVGDRLLQDTAALVSAAAGRLGGVAGRLGGDEFVIATAGTTRDEVGQVLVALREACRLVQGSHGITYGQGFAPDLAQIHQTPAAIPPALFRVADDDLYRHKVQRKGTRATDSLVRRAQVPVHQDLLPPLDQLTASLADPASSVLDRLREVAEFVCRAHAGAVWWVNQADLDAGTVWAVASGSPRDDVEREVWRPRPDPTIYRLADYPCTEKAVRGGSFFVSALEGDPAEQLLLGQNGARSLVAAGAGDGQTGWLIEIYGDARTPALEDGEGLLLSLTALAVSGRRG